MSITDQFQSLDERLLAIEHRLDTGYDLGKIVKSEVKKRWKIQPQAETMFGMVTCLTIDTIDPLKQNRVRYFSPLLHHPKTAVEALPFAWPISSMGGIDDCGLNWVPPAGSTLCIVFENGSRDAAYYIGTTWHRDRGADGAHNWGYNIEEYYKIHEGHRLGYKVGPKDGSQVLPQWNTENYNGYDIDSLADFSDDPNATKKVTYPNIYGFKTPQKHMLKMVDGDYKCNHKNKRIEMLSACGNWMMFKDDHLHEFDPSAGQPDCAGESTACGAVSQAKIGSPYFKHENEMRPYTGPGTPQNNKCDLKQSGIQLLSVSGHSFVMDDSVDEPSGIPNWERGNKTFDFGCTNKFKGKTAWTSATGHKIIMQDVEEPQEVRGKDNYIRIISASGNKIELNDHTIGPNKVAGEKRGITMQSTSNHTFQMIDQENEQISPVRAEGGGPVSKAKKAYVKIRSGYGLEFLMKDADSQGETQQQHIQIFCPQKTNTLRGPHIMRFQEKPSGPGQIFIRAGGNYIISTFDNHTTLVGSDENSANKLTVVTNNTLHITAQTNYEIANLHVFQAKKRILLLAGNDCPKPEDAPAEDPDPPCIWPVLVLSAKGVTISDRVFASASLNANCASIFQMRPFIKCQL